MFVHQVRRHTVLRNFFVAAALAIPAALGAQQPGPVADVTAVAARLEKAAINDNVQGVKDARIACLRLLAAAPGGPRAALLRYTIAYAGWRLAFAPALPPAEQNALLADAAEQLTQAVKLDASFAEAYGLLSSVYGAQIAKNSDLGMTLGPAAGGALGRAIGLDPNSPRLVMLQGLSLLHTPVEFGGDPAQAEAGFRRAVQMFKHEPAAKAWPNWGRFDAHLWLGQALAGHGDHEGARAEYAAALVLAPGSSPVRYLLSQLK
jgi:tetratricopeptide (TPR) repeat protein